MALYIIIIQGLMLIAGLIAIILLAARARLIKTAAIQAEEFIKKHRRVIYCEPFEEELVFPVVPGTNGKKVFFFDPKSRSVSVEDWMVLQEKFALEAEDKKTAAEEGKEGRE